MENSCKITVKTSTAPVEDRAIQKVQEHENKKQNTGLRAIKNSTIIRATQRNPYTSRLLKFACRIKHGVTGELVVHVLFIDVIQETPHADKMLRQQKSVANQEGLSGLTAWFLKENTKLGGYKSISSNVHVVLVLAKSRARSVPQSPRCIIR